MVSQDVIRWWIWVVPLVIIVVLIIFDLWLFFSNEMKASLPQVSNLSSSYVSSDATKNTQTWTISWDSDVPGATYNYFMSKVQNFSAEMRLDPIPVGINGSTTDNSITFSGLPSSSTYDISVYVTAAGDRSEPSTYQWCSKVMDGDMLYIFTSAQGMVGIDYNIPDVYVAPQSQPYPGATAFKVSMVATDTFVFYNALSNALTVDPTTFILGLGDGQGAASQITVEYPSGGIALRSVVSNQYIAFVGTPDSSNRPTALANNASPQIFSLASSLYFLNGQPLNIGSASTGLFLQFFAPEDPFSVVYLLMVDSPYPTDDSFTFYPQYQTDGSWRFLLGYSNLISRNVTAYVGTTVGGQGEIVNICFDDPNPPERLVLGRSQGDNDYTAYWQVTPLTFDTFYLYNSGFNSYMQFCTGCCTSTLQPLPSNFMEAQASQPGDLSRLYTELGTF